MTRYYSAGTCPHCRQGRLVLQRNESSRRIYAHCEECEWGFNAPGDIQDEEKGFLTLLADYETSDPSREDIDRSVWKDRVTGSFDRD